MSSTDDERFAEIVAGFGADSDEPVPRWPTSEDVLPATIQPEQPAGELPGWLEPAALEDDGHFQPPPAPKVPRLRPRTLFAIALVVLGLTVLFAPYRIGLDDSTPFLLVGLMLVAGGAALLVAWMRDAPPAGSGSDDGAVV